jgi:hypothetical protein
MNEVNQEIMENTDGLAFEPIVTEVATDEPTEVEVDFSEIPGDQ